VRRPRVTLAIMLVLSAYAIYGLTRLSFDSSLETLTAHDDPARAFHAKVQQTFGDQEIGVVALIVDDVYQPQVLEALRDLTKAIGEIQGVDRALSLANASDPTADPVTPPPLLPRGPVTPAVAAKVRERVAANPLYIPHLAARDGGAVAINVFFARNRSEEDEPRIDASIMEVVSGYKGPGAIYYAGMSHIRVRSTQMMRADLGRFLPLSLLCMMGVLWASFRSYRATLLPLASIALGVAVLLGLMGWVGAQITLTTLVLPSLLMVIGGAYAVYVTAAALEGDAEGEASAIGAILRRVGYPIAVSAFTTALGFGSLALSPIPAIARLGIFAVVGSTIMAVGTVFGLSLFFLAVPSRARKPQAGESSGGYLTTLDRTLERATEFATTHRGLVFAVVAVVAVVAAIGTDKIEVDTDLLSGFRRGSEVRVAYDAISEEIAGPNPVSIVITGPEAGYFKSIAALRRVKDFQDFLADLDEIDSSISLVDYLEEVDLGLQASGGEMVVNEKGEIEEKPPPPSFWDAPAEQLPRIFDLIALSPQTFSGVVDSDFRQLRITARTSISGSYETKELVREIEHYGRVIFPPGVEVKPTGNLVVLSTVADKLLGGQIDSLVLSFGVIFVLLVVQFLSIRVALAATVANILPVLVFFGIMGWAGVELNLATSIIANIALGIAVDDTIHYMAVLNRMVKVAPDRPQALRLTIKTVGRPVVFTSLTLTAGFLVMLVSGFGLIATFGWLSATTMMVALITNTVILPAVLATVPVITVWDLVAFRLGPQPHKTIPLFAGLGSFSVRLVVLLGRVKDFAREQHIVRSGEAGHEMYMVLRGTADVTTEDGRTLARLKRGDVFGEMALLRQAERVASVVTRDDVEVLVIDESFLRRLRNLYPRFAATFFLNIARILSDRLEEANRRNK
jgi:predicted RND superfamily exporter protein